MPTTARAKQAKPARPTTTVDVREARRGTELVLTTSVPGKEDISLTVLVRGARDEAGRWGRADGGQEVTVEVRDGSLPGDKDDHDEETFSLPWAREQVRPYKSLEGRAVEAVLAHAGGLPPSAKGDLKALAKSFSNSIPYYSAIRVLGSAARAVAVSLPEEQAVMLVREAYSDARQAAKTTW
jgi:hypothetical protein